MNIFLDSSAIIDYLKGNGKAKEVTDAADEVYTSSLCAFEVLLGETYAKLKGFKHKGDAVAFLGGLTVISFDNDDARVAARALAQLMLKGIAPNSTDVLIAASSARMGLDIVTSDRDYGAISSVLELRVIKV